MSKISVYLKDRASMTPAELYQNIIIKSGLIDVSYDENEEIDVENLDVSQVHITGISQGMVDGVTKFMEKTIQSIIYANISELTKLLGINEETMNMALKAVTISNNSITLVDSIIKSIPSNIYTIPSGSSCTGVLYASFKDMYDAMLIGLHELYYTTINDYITGLPSSEEIQKDVIDFAVAKSEEIINAYCYEFTGYTPAELYYMVKPYIDKYKQYRRLRKQKNHAKTKNIKVSVKVDSEAVKKDLMDELSTCSDLIYNSFIIILIQDIIQLIKDITALFHDIDLSTLTDGIDSFSDVMELLEELGLGDDNKTYILSLEQTLQSSINNFSKNAKLLTDSIVTLGISSVKNLAKSTIKNINPDISIKNTYMYEFTADPKNGNIQLSIYADPTTSKFKNKLNKTLSKKTEDGNQYMENNDILLMFTKLEDCFFDENVPKEITINNIKYVFNFDIPEEPAELENVEEEPMHTDEVEIELGVVKEEYYKDPTRKAQKLKRAVMLIVHELYLILEQCFPVLKTILVLISNYKTNKEKVKNNALGNLDKFARLIAKLKGLHNKAKADDMNIYTIRTLRFYNYINENINEIDNAVLITIDSDQTQQIYDWLKNNDGSYENIDVTKSTLLYIDFESIKSQQNLVQNEIDTLSEYFDDPALFVQYPEPKYKDGDTLGLDKLEFIGDEVYYADSSLPIYGSQILNAHRHT